MTYVHTLNQVKAVLGIQQSLGSRRLQYDADFHRERDTWWESNLDVYNTHPDGLKVEHGEASGRINFNMESGEFIQTFKDSKSDAFKANLDGFETFFGRARNVGYTINGTSGNNYISTSDSRDFVDGGKGHDQIWTGKGDDIIRAGSGVDYVFSGDGRDAIITKQDRGFALICDFEIGQDRLLIDGGMRNVNIKNHRDADFDSYREDLLSGISAWGPNLENSLINASMVFKGNDLVAVITSTEASDLSIVGSQIM